MRVTAGTAYGIVCRHLAIHHVACRRSTRTQSSCGQRSKVRRQSAAPRLQRAPCKKVDGRWQSPRLESKGFGGLSVFPSQRTTPQPTEIRPPRRTDCSELLKVYAQSRVGTRSIMPDTRYRLCGFAGGVDWRPINFKQRLQTTRVCRLCGVVPRSIAVLPCTHFLCESCLGGCADGNRSACPLDKMSFEADADVSWISFPQKHMERLQVGCWNAQNGCDYVGPAGELLDHFEKNCSFHAASCPRCHDRVLVRDMPRHYGAGCGGIAAHPPTEKNSASFVPTTSALDAAACGCHDMLTSIQGRVNDLAEAMSRLGARLPDDEAVAGGQPTSSHQKRLGRASSSSRSGASTSQSVEFNELLSALEEVKVAVTGGFSSAGQGASRDTAGPSRQSRTPPVLPRQTFSAPPPAVTASCSSAQTVVDNGESVAELVVFSLLYRPFNNVFTGKDMQVVWHNLFLSGEDTGVCIRCVVLRNATFVPIYAMSTQPARWKLPDVRPLCPEDLSSPSLREWVSETAKEPGREYLPVSAYAPDLRLRCLVDVTSQTLKKSPSGEVQIDLLIKLERRFSST